MPHLITKRLWACSICDQSEFETEEKAQEHERRLGVPTPRFQTGSKMVLSPSVIIGAPKNGDPLALIANRIRYYHTVYGGRHMIEYELYDPVLGTRLGWYDEWTIHLASL